MAVVLPYDTTNALALPFLFYYKKTGCNNMLFMEDDFGSGCLRVAASSNKPINADRKHRRYQEVKENI